MTIQDRNAKMSSAKRIDFWNQVAHAPVLQQRPPRDSRGGQCCTYQNPTFGYVFFRHLSVSFSEVVPGAIALHMPWVSRTVICSKGRDHPVTHALYLVFYCVFFRGCAAGDVVLGLLHTPEISCRRQKLGCYIGATPQEMT